MMRIAFLGTGLMGAPMARRLLAAGHELSVYNRTREKAEALAAHGAQVAESGRAAIASAECIILMLADIDAIRAVLLDDESRPALEGRTVIQMGTIAPQESRDLADELEQTGATYLEAPVLGSVPEAQAGRLIVMTGAEREAFERWRDVLACLGSEPRHVGGVGQAAAAKLALNQLIAALTSAFALSLGFVQREGVDVERFMELLRGSALYAPTFDKKLDRMQRRHYDDPNFPVQHLLKDVRLFLREADAVGLNAATLEGCQEILDKAMEMGLDDADYSALYNVVDPKKS